MLPKKIKHKDFAWFSWFASILPLLLTHEPMVMIVTVAVGTACMGLVDVVLLPNLKLVKKGKLVTITWGFEDEQGTN